MKVKPLLGSMWISFAIHSFNMTLLNIYICQQASIIMTRRSWSPLISLSDSVYQLRLVSPTFPVGYGAKSFVLPDK